MNQFGTSPYLADPGAEEGGADLDALEEDEDEEEEEKELPIEGEDPEGELLEYSGEE